MGRSGEAETGARVGRRAVMAGGAAAALLGCATGRAQAPTAAVVATAPSVVSTPPRQWGPGAPPTPYPDPDVIILDPAFQGMRLGTSGLKRVWTGASWAEGPAWSSQGQYLVFSDVVGDVQHRYLWETGEVTSFRKPSFNSNGNTFDFEGRQVSAQDFFRRVVRWEHDGSMTVLADRFEGKPLNSPNDLVAHPDGSVWFTDPPYGDTLSEGHPDAAGGPANPAGLFDMRLGTQGLTGAAGGLRRELPNAVYRCDPSGRLDLVIPETALRDPNGLCFSPDYKTLYVTSTGRGPGDAEGGTRTVHAFDVQGRKLANPRELIDMTVDGLHLGPDGLRADTGGNLWCAASGPLGYCGVLVYSSKGRLIGRIRLPEVCPNLAFGGPKRNVLFMTASQSLYMLQVQAQGAGCA